MAEHPHPIFKLVQDGNNITSRLADRLESLTITDNRGLEADQLEVTLVDDDGLLDIPMRGVQLSVSIGWRDTGLVEKGTYTVDEVEHSGAPDRLTIRARSADLRAGLTQQKERSWHGLRVGDIVRKVAKENNLKAIIADPFNLKSIVHIDQTNESDISFLTRIARMFDALVNVKNGNLLFMTNGEGLSATGKSLTGVTITRADGDSHRFSVADRDGATAVKALYQDTATAKKGEIIIDESNLNGAPQAEEVPDTTTATSTEKVFTISKQYGSKSSATRAAREKFRALQKSGKKYTAVLAKYKESGTGNTLEVRVDETNLNKPSKKEIKEDYAPPTLQASADNMKVLRHIYANRQNAIRAAKSEFRRMRRGVATFSINLALGRPDITAEMPLTVSGFKPAIDSTKWVVARIVHSLTSTSLTSSLDAEMKIEELAAVGER